MLLCGQVTGRQRRPCSEYVAAAMGRASALGATDEMHHLPLLQQLLTGTVKEAKADRYEMHHPLVVAGVILCRRCHSQRSHREGLMFFLSTALECVCTWIGFNIRVSVRL